MSTRSFVNADDPFAACLSGFFGEFSLGDVVIDHPAERADSLNHPSRVSQGSDKESDSLFQGDIQPLAHPFLISFGGALRDHIKSDGFAG